MHPSLAPLQELGWQIVENPSLTIPGLITDRYGDLPPAWLDRFGCVERCVDPCNQTWFITPLEMHGTSGSAFAWNEAEKQSLEAAEDDTEWASEITTYWDTHLPIMFSVASGYETWSICLKGSNSGKIIHALAPEFEDGSIVAEGLEQFLNQIIGAELE